MSPPGRPKGECRSAQHEGTPVTSNLKRLVAAGLLLALLVFAGLGLASYRSTQQLAASAADSERAQRVLTLLAALRATLAEAGNGGAKAAALEQVSALRPLLATDAAQYSRAVALGPLLNARFEPPSTPEQAQRVQDRLRAAITELQQNAESALTAQQQRSEAAAGKALGLIALCSATALLALALAAWRAWRDFSARQRDAAALAASEQAHAQAAAQLQRWRETSLDTPCQLDADGCFLEPDAASEALWGWPTAAIRSAPYLDHVLPEDRARLREGIALALAGTAARALHHRWRRADGSVVHLLFSASALGADGTLLCLARDVGETEALRAQTAQQTQALQQRSEEVAQAQSRATAAEALRARLLDTLGRELRAPVNAVADAAAVLQQGLVGPPSPGQQRPLKTLSDAAQRMQAFISDTLDLAALDAGQVALIKEPFDLCDVIATVAAQLRPQAAAQGLALRVAIDDALVGLARGDGQRTADVLRKLLAHAIASTEAGSVTLHAAPHETQTLRVTVTNTRTGMTPEVLAQLFDPYRGELGGLALPIAQRLAHLMGGDVAAGLAAAGGCEMSFTLPAA